MKKIILTLAVVLFATSANALPSITGKIEQHPSRSIQAHYAYKAGYDNGKTDAYNHVVRTVFVTGMVVVAGIMIYELGKDTRWTANESGIVYRF